MAAVKQGGIGVGLGITTGAGPATSTSTNTGTSTSTSTATGVSKEREIQVLQDLDRAVSKTMEVVLASSGSGSGSGLGTGSGSWTKGEERMSFERTAGVGGHLMVRHGLLSPHPKLLPGASRETTPMAPDGRPGSIMSVTSNGLKPVFGAA
ncbi:hypothetical protein JR316_0011195 [Psilocybe cubensis]|uniref:Uncharacterized protein n=1 Tax=Psilocybe cubensis TaxID=181762 RepID=A0ACB8GKT6_PSICU|nr:hypothetical protein JR316_0011195 [Psilocybe cubensis]KAH9475640.1 hypothetical protein JR316_0011195 [Psilocybe cubensis]